MQAGGIREDCSLQDVFFSRLGHTPSIRAIVACVAMMVNHHLRLLLCVLNDLLIVTCAESRDRPPGRKVIDEGKCVGHCACERQEQRVLLNR